MNNLGYYAYMAEQEGLINTREGRINRVILDIKQDGSPTIEGNDFIRICKRNGIDAYTLTSKELNRIKAAVR